MKSLKPVSFKQARAYEPRLSKPYVPGKHSARFWTDDEKAVIRKYYADGGVDACLVHLPAHRTGSGVYQQAQKMGLASNRKGQQHERRATPELDATIREEWAKLDGKKKGEVAALADRLHVPRWWLSQRARKIGLVIPHKKEPPWTEAELALLRKVPLDDCDRAAEIFHQNGYNRTPTSIRVKSKRERLLIRERRDWLTATSASKILGVDAKWVTAYCISGELPAQKREDKRRVQQGGHAWVIQKADFRKFIIDHLERIDFRKVEKFEFVDLLVDTGEPVDSHQ